MSLEQEYDVFVRAAEGFVSLVAGIDPTTWDSPGLGDWDLRALVGHTSRSLITVTEYVDQPVESPDLDSPEAYYLAAAAMARTHQAAIVERGREAGDALGPDPATAVAGLAEAAITRLRDQTDLLMHTLLGGMWLSDYLPTRTFELVVHGVDIARATQGSLLAVDESALAAATVLAARIAVAQDTGLELLLTLTGRGTLPRDFSVV